MAKMIVQDYTTVSELVKATKGRIKVNRMGNSYAGIYWEVIMDDYFDNPERDVELENLRVEEMREELNNESNG